MCAKAGAMKVGAMMCATGGAMDLQERRNGGRDPGKKQFARYQSRAVAAMWATALVALCTVFIPLFVGK
jgi:hypothetical protein